VPEKGVINENDVETIWMGGVSVLEDRCALGLVCPLLNNEGKSLLLRSVAGEEQGIRSCYRYEAEALGGGITVERTSAAALSTKVF